MRNGSWIRTVSDLWDVIRQFKVEPVHYIEDCNHPGVAIIVVDGMKWWMWLRLYRLYKFKKYISEHSPVVVCYEVLIQI